MPKTIKILLLSGALICPYFCANGADYWYSSERCNAMATAYRALLSAAINQNMTSYSSCSIDWIINNADNGDGAGMLIAYHAAICDCLINRTACNVVGVYGTCQCDALRDLCCGQFSELVSTDTKTETRQSYTYDYSSHNCSVSNNSYFCKEGYYGRATGVNTGCAECPAEWKHVSGAYSISATVKGQYEMKRATTIADCYYPAGSYRDETGTFTTTEECPY